MCSTWEDRLRMAANSTDVEGSSDAWSSCSVFSIRLSVGPGQFLPGVPNWWVDLGVLHPGHFPFREDIFQDDLNKRIDRYFTRCETN